jgi:hypothetical protein
MILKNPTVVNYGLKERETPCLTCRRLARKNLEKIGNEFNMKEMV